MSPQKRRGVLTLLVIGSIGALAIAIWSILAEATNFTPVVILGFAVIAGWVSYVLPQRRE